MNNNQKAIELLKKAKARVEKGWAYKFFYIPEQIDLWTGRKIKEKVCAHKALGDECKAVNPYGSPEACIAFNACWDVISGESYTSDLVTWNDMPGRTKEEVLEMFDKAIEKIEKNK